MSTIFYRTVVHTIQKHVLFFVFSIIPTANEDQVRTRETNSTQNANMKNSDTKTSQTIDTSAPRALSLTNPELMPQNASPSFSSPIAVVRDGFVPVTQAGCHGAGGLSQWSDKPITHSSSGVAHQSETESSCVSPASVSFDLGATCELTLASASNSCAAGGPLDPPSQRQPTASSGMQLPQQPVFASPVTAESQQNNNNAVYVANFTGAERSSSAKVHVNKRRMNDESLTNVAYSANHEQQQQQQLQQLQHVNGGHMSMLVSDIAKGSWTPSSLHATASRPTEGLTPPSSATNRDGPAFVVFERVRTMHATIPSSDSSNALWNEETR